MRIRFRFQEMLLDHSLAPASQLAGTRCSPDKDQLSRSAWVEFPCSASTSSSSCQTWICPFYLKFIHSLPKAENLNLQLPCSTSTFCHSSCIAKTTIFISVIFYDFDFILDLQRPSLHHIHHPGTFLRICISFNYFQLLQLRSFFLHHLTLCPFWHSLYNRNQSDF